MIYSCRGCKRRHINCHQDCKEYAIDKKKHKTINQRKKTEGISISMGHHSWNYSRKP